jgi:membrane-associated phospholipid phosphatase
MPINVPPTRVDIAIANAVARSVNPPEERAARLVTWGADEHILVALAAAWWLASRKQAPARQRNADHVLVTTVVSSVIPHLLKTIFDQERPDRLTVRGHWRGVPLSGKKYDAFPSGHAIHIGALASAAAELPERNIVWTVGAGLVLTRVVLLAHWTTDVLAGLALGAGLERLIRLWTGFGRFSRR